MDPPKAIPPKRRAVSMQTSSRLTSLSPLSSNLKPLHSSAETRRPRTTTQRVSLDWNESDDLVLQRTSSLQIELADCVETQTVTTTTTTKRSYPPILFQQPSMDKRDVKQYPLASKPTPSHLAKFSYDIDASSLADDFQLCRVMQEQDEESYPPIDQNDEARLESRPAFSSLAPEKAEKQRAEKLAQKLALITPRRAAKGLQNFRPKSSQSLGEASEVSRGNSPHGTLPVQHGLGMHLLDNTLFPATPTSDAEALNVGRIRPFSRTKFFEDSFTPQSGRSQYNSFREPMSPSAGNNNDTFASAVATPPIAESDLEPLDDLDAELPLVAPNLPVLSTATAQNASLPSPGLSPTFTAAELGDVFPDAAEGVGIASPQTELGESQLTIAEDDLLQLSKTDDFEELMEESSALTRTRMPSIVSTKSMLDTFDAMPSDMQSFMMYQFLRRCNRKTLHEVAAVVNPALKCDFLGQLPLELSLHVISFLDYKDYCRCAQVSSQWRNIVDSHESGWKAHLDQDGFVVPEDELRRAVTQGWGWQDPYGPDGCELDLSIVPAPQPIPIPQSVKVERLRSGGKRKRATASQGGDRIKRRAGEHESSNPERVMKAKYPSPLAKFHKSEGPNTAANAAALAVPDPQIGLASLRKLHLFKSLYRRHYVLRRNWMSGKVEPYHFAFLAHPTHVITCLQFDDDKILTGSDDALIHVYDTRTGKLRTKLEGHEGGVWALQYEGNVLVSGSTDRSVRVWDIKMGICTQVFHGHTSTVRCLQIVMPDFAGHDDRGHPIMIPEKPLIITGSRDSQLRVWKLPEAGQKRYVQNGPLANDADCPWFLRVLGGHTHSVRAIAAHRDTLVSGSYDHTVRVWKISTGETIHRLQGHAMKVYSVVLDHKRKRCISGSMDQFVKIWSLETGSCLFTLEGHSSLVGLLDLRDERLVSAAADSTLRIWDPENGQCKSTLTAHTGAITCFQHDGQKVISGSDRTLKMWNVKTGDCMKDLLTDLSGVWQVKFDERRCVAAVQRDNLTYVEVLDFGASRDGIPASRRGARKLLRLDDGPSRALGSDESA